MAGIKEEYDMWSEKMAAVEADIKKAKRGLMDFSSGSYCKKRKRLAELECVYEAMKPYKEALERIMEKDGLCWR